MSGSDDFSPTGKARKGFLKIVKPLLEEEKNVSNKAGNSNSI